jgi:MarR family
MVKALRPHGVTFPQYEALLLLDFSKTGALPLGLMGRRLTIHPATVTNTIDQLESKGLAQREPHPTDRRGASEEAAGARVRRSLQQTVFRRCSATRPSTPEPGRRRVRISGDFGKALYRTRTDDPFLTISRREIPANSECRRLQEIRWCARFSDAAGFRWRVVL